LVPESINTICFGLLTTKSIAEQQGVTIAYLIVVSIIGVLLSIATLRVGYLLYAKLQKRGVRYFMIVQIATAVSWSFLAHCGFLIILSATEYSNPFISLLLIPIEIVPFMFVLYLLHPYRNKFAASSSVGFTNSKITHSIKSGSTSHTGEAWES